LLLVFIILGIFFQFNLLADIDFIPTNTNQTYNNPINYKFMNIAIEMKSGLNGTVYFMGLECPPTGDKKTPPCSGPYPNYEILVYDEGGNNVIAKTKTNDKGEYFILLEPKNYVIYTQAGISNQSNLITIKENEITNKNLTIDKGIR
jgi:hypothetical protein